MYRTSDEYCVHISDQTKLLNLQKCIIIKFRFEDLDRCRVYYSSGGKEFHILTTDGKNENL